MGFLAPVLTFAKAIFVGTTVGGFYSFAVNVARIGLLALGSKLLAPKPDLTELAVTKQLTVRDPIAPQQFTYGQDMISGPIVFSNVTGTDNRDLYMVIALTGHEIDSVQAYRIDSTDVPLTDLAGAEDGVVNNGKYDGVAEVDIRHGTSSQTTSTLLTSAFPSLFVGAHHGQGWSYMVWKFSLVEGSEDVFKTQPGNIRAEIRGRKVYDPRLDSTQVIDDTTSPQTFGSGTHRVNDSSTWEWSNNPALCLADFLMDDKFGMREETDRIDWPLVATAADICDELVAVPPAASPENTQKRYTCNATFSATETRKQVVEELLASMMGRMVFSQGVWKMWAGAAQTADVTLDEANLRGGLQIQVSSPSNERYNRVRGKFIDSSRDYVATTYVEQRSSTYETQDGGEPRELTLDLTSTTNEYEAQRKAIIALKQSRQQRVVVFEGNFSCFRIQPGTVVSVDISELGFSGEKFFVSDWKLGNDGVDLTLVEEIDSAWANPLVADYTVRSATGALVFGETGVAAPTGLTVSSIPGGVKVSWTNPIQNSFSHIEIWRANENVRSSAVLVGTSQGEAFFDATSDVQRTRYYWIRAVDNLGRVSAWLPNLTTTTATAYPQTEIVSLVADPFIRQGASFWDLSDGRANYRSGEGLNGTDTISLEGTSITTRFEAAKRRGPDTWDAESSGTYTVEVTWRVSLRTDGASSYSVAPYPVIYVTDEGSPENRSTYSNGTVGLRLFSFGDPTGVWYDQTAVIEVTDTGTPPRYIQIGFNLVAPTAPEFNIDYINAKIVGRTFVGGNATGLVPNAGSAIATDFLKSDGTWSSPNTWGATTAAETAASVSTVNYEYEPGNAKRYGATGDGVTDDTAALQDLINYCAINALPGYIPSGDYHVTRLYGKYDATNNPNGVKPDADGDFPRRFVLRGDGHLHDSGSLTGSGHARTSIVFSETTGTLIDLSVDNSDFAINANNTWQLRNLELEDFNLIGSTSGEVLDTSGAFKCRFHRLGIHNNAGTGDGWKMHNFDQVNVEDCAIIGTTSGTTTGTGLSLKNDESAADGIDGSLSVFRKILVQDFSLGYELGHDRDSSNGNFQQFNTFESCGSAQCTVGMFIGDRWENNTFNSCQIRGETHGLKMGSRAAQNTFNSCLFQASGTSTGVAGLVLGSGTAATAVQCQENTFNNCSLEQAYESGACLEVYGGTHYANIYGNDFIDCSFEYTGTAGDGTKGAIYYTVTSNGQLDFGSVIRPTFTNIDTNITGPVVYSDTNWTNNRTHFEHQERTILHRRLQITGSTTTTLGTIELATGETASVKAHIIAVDTSTPSQSCAYNLHGLFYNSAGTVTIIGGVTSVSTIEGDTNCSASLDGSGTTIRVRVTGDASQTYNWRGIIEVLTAPASTVL